VANLHRAGELIQSFKQVAGRPPHAERRQFSLNEATDQIVASLRPVLKRAAITLSVDVPEGLMIDGYPGSYGQILTNLFPQRRQSCFPPTAVPGRSRSGKGPRQRRCRDHLPTRAGMTPDVQRQAFEPRFLRRAATKAAPTGLAYRL